MGKDRNRLTTFDGIREVGFWAVLGDTDARCVRALFLSGHRREALWLLDRSARDMGRIFPSGPVETPLHEGATGRHQLPNAARS